ncbi:MAG: hypothetical protein ACYTEZ_00085 [Planctomycetota bacterium]|jgi:hypothetical protein
MGRSGSAILVLTAAILTFGAPTRPGREPAPPDLLFFSQRIAGDLHARCAGCHSDPESAGRYLLEPLDDLVRPDRGQLIRNYRATLGFLDPEAPGESPLLKRALGEAGHPGGAIYTSVNSRDFQALRHFAMGATLDNLPPEAIVQQRYEARVGTDLAIDGSLSGDPEESPLAFHWQLLEKPPGSHAVVGGADRETARLLPDRAGLYRIDLAVGDGRLWSLPASLTVVARPRGGGEVPRATEPVPERVERAPTRSLLQRRLDPRRLKLVRRLFLDLKWRTPRYHEIEEWYDRTHAEMVRAFLADEETWDAWYEQQLFYLLLLDRFRPKEGRLATIPGRLTRGELALERALEEIVRSQYFNARNPGNDTFVTVVLEQCLGMVVQQRRNKRVLETGKKMYDGYRVKLFKETGDSQADFVRIVFKQRDFHRHLLRRTWKGLLGREIDAKRLEAYVDRCQAKPDALRRIYEEWLTGPEYVAAASEARTKPEIPYVRALFLDLLDRLPSYQELRKVRNAFLSLADPTPVRLVMGRVLLESDQARIPASAVDPKRFVFEQFVRLLARQPTEHELTNFVHALKNDPAVTPRVVLYTLISSPEYQSY